jgi:alpha-tubulin suppressor-like RCC1 family protein
MVVVIAALLAAAWMPGTGSLAHAAAVSGGTVYGWGTNSDNELGFHPTYTTSVYVKVRIPAGVRFTSFAAGQSFTLALASNGAVYGWGDNSNHQLGLSHVSSLPCLCTSTPVRIPFPAGVKVKAIAAGWDHSLALASDGRIYGWGANFAGELGKNNDGARVGRPTLIPLPSGVRARAIATGWAHSLALGADGHLYAWGFNTHGQLGIGTAPVGSTVPVRVALPTGVKITAISAGEQHNLALAADGSIYAWGRNNGQIGDGTTTDRLTPVRITLPGNARAIAVAAGLDHSLAIASDGAAYQWGIYHLRLGQATVKVVGTPAPTRVKLPKGVTARGVAAGEWHFSLVRGSDGAIYAWGDNTYGVLGDGSTTPSPVPARVHMPPGVSTQVIAAGRLHSLVLGSNGALYAWGDNRSGQLGAGDLLQSTVPVPAHGLAGVGVQAVSGDAFLRSDGTIQIWGQRPLQLPGKARATAIATGYGSVLALAASGHIYTWQYNGAHQLSSRVPVRVRLPAGMRATAIAAGSGFSLAATSTGAVYAWGVNFDGQLGTGDTASSNLPVRVRFPAGVRVTAVSAAGTSSLAATKSGAVYFWGSDFIGTDGFLGQLTRATPESCVNGGTAPCVLSPVPIPLPGGFKARAVAAASGYGMAAGSNGDIYAWGFNQAGQLGIGRTTPVTSVLIGGRSVIPTSELISPERVKMPAGVRAVSIGVSGDDSIAITAGGDLYAWGANDAGQLGIGRVSTKPSPSVPTPTRVHLPAGLRAVSVAVSTDHTLAVTSRQ